MDYASDLNGSTPYTGADNLEAMRAAVRYNSFLTNLILQHTPSHRLVDFGAGSGTFAAMVAAKGREVVCVEPDSDLREVIRLAGLDPLSTLDHVPDASVEGLYSLNVLEHIEDDGAIVKGWFDKVAPGARSWFMFRPSRGCSRAWIEKSDMSGVTHARLW